MPFVATGDVVGEVGIVSWWEARDLVAPWWVWANLRW